MREGRLLYGLCFFSALKIICSLRSIHSLNSAYCHQNSFYAALGKGVQILLTLHYGPDDLLNLRYVTCLSNMIKLFGSIIWKLQRSFGYRDLILKIFSVILYLWIDGIIKLTHQNQIVDLKPSSVLCDDLNYTYVLPMYQELR